MSAATQNEMDRLYRERDRAREERDALLAHAKQLIAAAEKALLVLTSQRTTLEEWADAITALRVGLATEPETSLARLKAKCWKEAYLAGMEYGHHWTVEGGYVPDDGEAAEDYVADRQAEEMNNARP